MLEAVCQWRRFKLCNFNFNLKFIVVTVSTSFIQVRIIALGTLYLKVYLLALFVLWSLKKLRYQRWQYSFQLELNWSREIKQNTRRRSTQVCQRQGGASILAAQLILHKSWTWDTPHHLVELMMFTLIDFGQGPFLLVTTFSFLSEQYAAQWSGK